MQWAAMLSAFTAVQELWRRLWGGPGGSSGVLLPGEPGDSGDSGDFPWAVEDWGEAAGWVAWRDSGSEAHLLQLKVTVRMVGKGGSGWWGRTGFYVPGSAG